MIPNKPYLIRAFYEWIVDNDLTPYLLFSAHYPGVVAPLPLANKGKIVINISPISCRGLHLNNDKIIFTTKFSGKVEEISLPPAAVLAIYAKENGQGMEFPYEEPALHVSSPVSDSKSSFPPKKPNLKLVKQDFKSDGSVS